MINSSTFLVAGGTGRQGGAVIEALLSDSSQPIPPERVYVITRDPNGTSATRLASRGLQLVHGDLSEPNAIFKPLQEHGVDLNKLVIFLAQAHGPSELPDAIKFIDAAAVHGIPYFVYSSVDRGGSVNSDKDASYCKTFSDKYHIEKHLREVASRSQTDAGAKQSSMDYTILRPVWFAENAIWGFPGRLCMTGWRENLHGKRMQVVVLKDLGRWAAEAMLRPDRSGIRNQAISVASDELDFDEVDAMFREETGQPVGVTYGLLARFVIWAVKDLRTMFAWIDEREYGADLAWLKKTVEPTSFRDWVREVSIPSKKD